MNSFDPDQFAQHATPQNFPSVIDFAPISKRFIAMLIDGFITYLLSNVVSYAVNLIWQASNTVMPDITALQADRENVGLWLQQFSPFIDLLVMDLLFTILAIWLYYALFESSGMQATPGKMIMGMKVTDADGDQIGFGMATGRYLGKLIAGFLLGLPYITALFTSKKQAMHDLIAGTIVINK